jgi:hypothetical protein
MSDLEHDSQKTNNSFSWQTECALSQVLTTQSLQGVSRVSPFQRTSSFSASSTAMSKANIKREKK